MRLRMLSGRPRQLQILVVSLVVLVLGIATGLGRASRPTAPLETEAAAAVSTGSDEFIDVPPSPVTTTPPPTAPAETPTTAPPAPPDDAARVAEAAPPAPAVAPPVEVAAPKPIIPLGKGMWLYQL